MDQAHKLKLHSDADRRLVEMAERIAALERENAELRQQLAEADPLATPIGQVVLRAAGERLAGMSAADILAWRYLAINTRMGREQIVVTPGEIAGDQGKTSDTGVTRLKNLRERGLTRAVETARKSGRYLTTLLLDGLQSNVGIAEGDPQHRLGFAAGESSFSGATATAAATGHVGPESASAGPGTDGRDSKLLRTAPCVPRPTEVPPEEPPEEPRHASLSLSLNDVTTSSLSLEERALGEFINAQRERIRGDRGSSGGSSAGSSVRPTEQRIDALIARSLEQPTAARVQSAAQQAGDLIAYMRHRINDVRMQEGRLAEVAWFVVDGQLPRATVDRILGHIADKRRLRLPVNASKYFNSSITNALKELRLWKPKPKPR